uniref:CCHC-type domain-containing protein n=1 Tax=Schizaphis graminum TaxID=13262 RepID=A0A2S2P7D3_SCHGA
MCWTGCMKNRLSRTSKHLTASSMWYRSLSGTISVGRRVATFTTSLESATRLKEAGCILVRLDRCRVKVLEAKKFRCFRCEELGHAAASCTAEEASKKKCFRCRQTRPLVATCPGPPSATNHIKRQISENPKRDEKSQATSQVEMSQLPAGGSQANA